jgi:ankyrin repeat protein
VQLCVEYNADVNAQDEDNGGSPLMYAIHNSHDHIVDILLQLGAGMDQFEQQGYTPLMVACLSDNVTACERLLKNNTDLDQTDSKGRTALSMACRCVVSHHHRPVGEVKHCHVMHGCRTRRGVIGLLVA